MARGGELGELIRTHDWAATSLGPPESWPRSLKTVVRIMLTSSQPIWVGWGPQLIYLYNDPYKSIIGGKHPHALGQPTSAVWHEIWGDIGPLLDTAMNGDGTFVESQLLIMERNGYREETYYTFSYSPIPGDDGVPAGIICANSDETQRVIGERQLALLRDMAARAATARTVSAAVERCMQALQTNRRDILFAATFLRRHGEERLTLAGASGLPSPPLARLDDTALGREPWAVGEVLATQRRKIVPLPQAEGAWPKGDWDRPPSHAMVLPIPATGDAGQEGVLVVGLNPYRLPDGSYTDFLELVAQQLSAALGNAQAHEAQQRRADELAQLDHAKTQFFSNISHEFRTPLTLMMGPIADLLAGTELGAAARERLQMAERNAMRLSKLVNSLLEFSRIEAGRVTSTFRPHDLGELTLELASTFQSAMDRAGLVFSVACSPLPSPVFVDRDHWERIVLNLLSNALKFTLEGSVSVRVRAEGESAVVEVADTGIGVAEHELPRLFERFHRIEGVQARTNEGSGIGLALVQELVRLHRGTVAANSQVGRGTTFVIRLPFGHTHLPPERVHTGELPSAHASEANPYVQEALRWLPDEGDGGELAAAQAGGTSTGTAAIGALYRSTQGARVLIADDNADMRRYLSSLLSPHFRVEAVADGAQALAAIHRERPALLLSDVMMPNVDGFQLLATLRAHKQLRTLPVILLSARAGEEARLEGLNSGADDYLVKPFTARELQARVSALIELDRMRRTGEEQLRLFLASARMFTWDIDLPSGKMSLSNNAADVLGAAPATLEGALSLVHPNDVDAHRATLEGAVRNRGSFTDETRIVRPDTQEIRWIEARAKVICDEAGNALRLSGICFDITERKRMEDALRDSDRRKDEFLAMLAHELRNPLAPIRTSGELLLRMTPDGAPSRRVVDIINRQTKQLTKMVDDLLDVSRITRGRVQLERVPVDLPAVVNAAIEAVEPMLLERRHTFQNLSGLPMTVMGDGARLQQCLVNLLSNAVKYTDPGGAILLDTRRDGSDAVITVTDNGAGIAPEVLPSVFDLFVQSARTLDRSDGGLGIGLSVVKRLIEMHGGQVAASSAGIGLGSSFEIRLPIVEHSGRAEAKAASAKGAQNRVLLVDDNLDAVESLAMLLEAEGHEVRVVCSAKEALSAAGSWQPDVVLLDIGLPEMDGYEVARRLKAHPGTARARLIALTGYGQPDDIQRASEAGFCGHLVKPAEIDRLLALIKKTRTEMV